MKNIKIILIFSLIIFSMLSFHNFVAAESSKGDEILTKEEQNAPSQEFKSENNNSNTNTAIMARATSADTTYTEGYYEYRIEKNYRITTVNVSNIITSDRREDVAVITKYTGNESTVTIPKTLGGKRVYIIDFGAFYQNTSIKKLIIPDNTVGYISNGAFADCTNLSEVTLGNCVKNISYYAFQHTAITSVKLPASLEAIFNTAFFESEKLTSITIDSKNEHFKVIDNVIYELYADGTMDMILYPYAKNTKSFTVPDKVKSIKYEAIINNYVETINIPASVNDIELDTYAFTTPNLKNIYVNNSNSTYSSIDGVLFSKDKKIIYYYPAGRTATSYNIPSGTKIISKDTFFKSANLKTVNIPNTVTTLDTEAFGYMPALQEITIPSSVTEIGAQIFPECPNLKKATVNANAEVLSYLMFKECKNLEEVIINGNIKTIIKGAFYYCTSLTKVTLPESLEKIEFGAFWDCWALKNITIPENVVFLEDCAFYDHTKPSKDYWADTNFDISKTKLVKQSSGDYLAAYYYDIQGTRLYDYAYQVLDLVNKERSKYNLKPLTMDKSLLETAMKRAEETVVYYDHERPNGYDWDTAITKTSYNYSAENIARYQTTPESVMNSWMNSEDHRANILNSGMTCIGIGCYRANDGRYYWVQNFTNGTAETVTKPQNTKTTRSIQLLMSRIPYSDVKETDWYFYAVKYNVMNKMILGYNSSTFAPNDTITRAMVVTILHRMEGSPYVAGTSKFPDVKNTNEYYYVAVKWATSKDIVHGYENGNFGPNDPVTREQLAVILNAYCKYKGKYKSVSADFSQFKDSNKISDFAKWGMNWAVGSNVITGSNGYLNPKSTATRAEFAAMLHKYKINVK